MKLAVSAATVSAIENGKTGVSTERLSHIAHVLDVSVEQLFEGFSDRPEVRATATPEINGVIAGGFNEEPRLVARLSTARVVCGLSGALSSFLEFGYHGASMRTVAARANISVPGLYHYYPSKHDMLVALLDLTLNGLRHRTRAARVRVGTTSSASRMSSNVSRSFTPIDEISRSSGPRSCAVSARRHGDGRTRCVPRCRG